MDGTRNEIENEALELIREFDEQFQGFLILALLFLLIDALLLERQNHKLHLSKFIRKGGLKA